MRILLLPSRSSLFYVDRERQALKMEREQNFKQAVEKTKLKLFKLFRSKIEDFNLNLENKGAIFINKYK